MPSDSQLRETQEQTGASSLKTRSYSLGRYSEYSAKPCKWASTHWSSCFFHLPVPSYSHHWTSRPLGTCPVSPRRGLPVAESLWSSSASFLLAGAVHGCCGSQLPEEVQDLWLLLGLLMAKPLLPNSPAPALLDRAQSRASSFFPLLLHQKGKLCSPVSPWCPWKVLLVTGNVQVGWGQPGDGAADPNPAVCTVGTELGHGGLAAADTAAHPLGFERCCDRFSLQEKNSSFSLPLMTTPNCFWCNLHHNNLLHD